MENSQSENAGNKPDKEVNSLLSDPAKRVALFQWLGRLDFPHLASSGSNRGGDVPTFNGSAINPSGMFPAPPGAYGSPAA